MFLIYTIIFLAANIGMGKFLHLAIAEEGFIDKFFGYQRFLGNLYRNEKNHLLCDFLGYCPKCFMHFVSILNFILYAVFMNMVFDNWISDDVSSLIGKIIVNIIWYMVYVSIAWFVSDKINNK